ncbi:hypothetical protein JCM8097_002517 [Rhodosporidiobolus ruineniae]
MHGQGVPLPRVPEHLRKVEGLDLDKEGDLAGVVTKLAIFTVAMVLLPLATYYLSRDYVFDSTTSLNYPAIAAVTAANLVLGAFIWVAFRDDQADYAKEKEAKLKEKAKTGKGE